MAALHTARPATALLYSAAGLRTIEIARRRGLSEEKAEALAESLRMSMC
jgi:DNA-binding CsgD family transcriptional regulator